MDDHSSQGSAQPVAALLRPLADSGPRARNVHEVGTRIVERPSTPPAGHSVRKPVLETSEFLVVEPDGTEDPGASADDGLLPKQNDGIAKRGKR